MFINHPGQWPYGGYNEIRKLRRKCKLIDYDALGRLTGFDDFLNFQAAHKKWVIAELQKNDHRRESQWSDSFVRSTRKQMCSLAVGRRVRTSAESCELRETMVSYNPHFEEKKSDIGQKTTWFRYENVELSD